MFFKQNFAFWRIKYENSFCFRFFKVKEFYFGNLTIKNGTLVANVPYGIIENNTAVIEMSAAAGITLVPEEKRNPLNTTTYGVGELIIDAINKGCRNKRQPFLLKRTHIEPLIHVTGHKKTSDHQVRGFSLN